MVIMMIVLCLFCVHSGQVQASESFTITGPMTIVNETVEWDNKDIRYSSSQTVSPVITVKKDGVLKITGDSKFHLESFGSLTAIKVEAGGKLLIDNSTFNAPNAANNNAFILVDGGEIELTNASRLQGTNTSITGNYLRVINGTLLMDSSYVSASVNSEDAEYPGIISTIRSEVLLKDSIFENCVVSGGGVVSAFADTSFRGTNIVSDGNTSSNVQSGMFFSRDTDIVIEGDSQFTGRNNEGNQLRQIYIEGGSLEIADGSYFYDNYTTSEGSVIYAENTDIRLGIAHFTDNRSNDYGGAIFAYGGNLTLNGTIFQNNESVYNDGGAIHFSSSEKNVYQITVNDAQFMKNKALRGGALSLYNGNTESEPEIRINSAVFTENEGHSHAGGAIYTGSNCKIYMNRAVFVNNTAGYSGGGILIGDKAHLEILPRNGAVLYDNISMRFPEQSNDVYINDHSTDTYELSDIMFNGYDFNWEFKGVDSSGHYSNTTENGIIIYAHPSGKDYSEASVVFQDNSSLASYDNLTHGVGGAICITYGSQLIIGEEAAEFTVKKIWDDRNDEYGVRQDPAEFLASLKVFANENSYELGDPVLIEKTTGDDGTDRYLFSFSEDRAAYVTVEDSHDDQYLATFKTLPKFIDGTEVTYRVEEADGGDYIADVRGSMAEGFVMTNRLNPYHDPLPVRVVWNDNNNSHGQRPAPEGYMSSLILYINGEAADWGSVSLIEKNTDASGADVYRFTAEKMPEAVLVLTDAKDNTYEITLEQLPRFIAGERPVYTVGQQELLNYQTDFSESSDGITVILNTWLEPENEMTFYRFDPGLKELPRTGFSVLHPQTFPSPGKVKTFKPVGFTVMIPSISVKAEVVRVPFDGSNYPVEWLENNVGLLEGSAKPGQGPCILTGHNHLNTIEAGPFALVNTLMEGDRIFILNDHEEVQTFIVSASEKIAFDDVSGLEAIVNRYPNALTLLTCEDEAESGGYAARRVISAVPYE